MALRFERIGPGCQLLDNARTVIKTRKCDAYSLAAPAVIRGRPQAFASFRLDFTPGEGVISIGLFPANMKLSQDVLNLVGRCCALTISGAYGGQAQLLCDGEEKHPVTGVRWKQGDTIDIDVVAGGTSARVTFKFKGRTENAVLPDVPACGLRFGAGLQLPEEGVTLLQGGVGEAAAGGGEGEAPARTSVRRTSVSDAAEAQARRELEELTLREAEQKLREAEQKERERARAPGQRNMTAAVTGAPAPARVEPPAPASVPKPAAPAPVLAARASVPAASAATGSTADAAETSWFARWTSKVLGFVQAASLDEEVESVVLLQIKPAVEETLSAQREWPIFFELLRKGFREHAHEIERIPFDELQETKVDVTRLQKYLEKTVEDDTFVIVAACPAAKMAQVRSTIAQFKRENKVLKSNVQLGYCERP